MPAKTKRVTTLAKSLGMILNCASDVVLKGVPRLDICESGNQPCRRHAGGQPTSDALPGYRKGEGRRVRARPRLNGAGTMLKHTNGARPGEFPLPGISNNVGSVKSFFERTSPFTPESVFVRRVLWFQRRRPRLACNLSVGFGPT